jgi:hypothetical protein
VGVAIWVWRAPSARAISPSAAVAGDPSSATPQTRHEMAREMARDFRASHLRGRGASSDQ